MQVGFASEREEANLVKPGSILVIAWWPKLDLGDCLVRLWVERDSVLRGSLNGDVDNLVVELREINPCVLVVVLVFAYHILCPIYLCVALLAKPCREEVPRPWIYISIQVDLWVPSYFLHPIEIDYLSDGSSVNEGSSVGEGSSVVDRSSVLEFNLVRSSLWISGFSFRLPIHPPSRQLSTSF